MRRPVLVIALALGCWLGWACNGANPVAPTAPGPSAPPAAPPPGAGFNLFVTALDGQDRTPVVGAWVAIVDGPNTQWRPSSVTNERGEYEFTNLIGSTFGLRLSHVAYETETRVVDLHGDSAIELFMRPKALGPGTSRLQWEGTIGPLDENGCLDAPSGANTNCREFSFIALEPGTVTVTLDDGTSSLTLYAPGYRPIAPSRSGSSAVPVRIEAAVRARARYAVTVSREYLQPEAAFHLVIQGPPMRSLPLD